MTDYNHIREFERLIARLFELMDYQSEIIHFGRDWGVDLIVVKGPTKHYIEVKFYRSKNIPASTLKDSANRLAYYLKQKHDGSGMLIVNTIVPKKLKEDILSDFGIYVWDRETIYSHLTELSIELRDQFEKLLLAVQQGTDTYSVFAGIDVNEAISRDVSLEKIDTDPKFKSVPINKGEELCKELKTIKCGRTDWPKYETKCLEILKHLFDSDLTLWEKQNKTEDGLSRFDLICRIASADDYWKALVSSFNTRFVLFEFKNYCEPIDQGQIYTTERYLYNKGLRSVGFIIAKNGSSSNAVTAAKGALKENGKLILLLSNEDLCAMLKLKDNNESPNDYLSNMLDTWLISLSR